MSLRSKPEEMKNRSLQVSIDNLCFLAMTFVVVVAAAAAAV